MMNPNKLADKLQKVGKVIIAISLGLIIGGVIILGISAKENQKNKIYYVRNCYGDTLEVTVYNGELVDARWGTPLMYCDKCHGIRNGQGYHEWNGLDLCGNCFKELNDKYNNNNS